MPKNVIYPITFLPVKSLKKTKQFYSGILKIPVALVAPKALVFRVGNGSYWGFTEGGELAKNPRRICLSITVKGREDVLLWNRYLTKKKVRCTMQPKESPKYKLFTSFYADPNDGFTVEIQAFVKKTGKPKGHREFCR